MELDRRSCKQMAGILKKRSKDSVIPYDRADVDRLFGRVERAWLGQGRSKDPAAAVRLAMEDLGVPLEQAEGVYIQIFGSRETLSLCEIGQIMGEVSARAAAVPCLTRAELWQKAEVEVTLAALQYADGPKDGPTS